MTATAHSLGSTENGQASEYAISKPSPDWLRPIPRSIRVLFDTLPCIASINRGVSGGGSSTWQATVCRYKAGHPPGLRSLGELRA